MGGAAAGVSDLGRRVRAPSELKLAITEWTTIWVPEQLALLDQRYSETHYSAKLGDYRSHLKMKPSEYFQRQVALGASCMPRREAEMRAEIGVANIMWGSDYPHPEGTWPFTREQMLETFEACRRRELAAMLGGNAATRLRLGRARALERTAERRIGPNDRRLPRTSEVR